MRNVGCLEIGLQRCWHWRAILGSNRFTPLSPMGWDSHRQVCTLSLLLLLLVFFFARWYLMKSSGRGSNLLNTVARAEKKAFLFFGDQEQEIRNVISVSPASDYRIVVEVILNVQLIECSQNTVIISSPMLQRNRNGRIRDSSRRKNVGWAGLCCENDLYE